VQEGGEEGEMEEEIYMRGEGGKRYERCRQRGVGGEV
jgi:hypothetical protein